MIIVEHSRGGRVATFPETDGLPAVGAPPANALYE